jgi:chromosome segregation ATPase
MAIDEGNDLTLREMKDMLEKKDKEIEQLRQLLGGWGGLDGLRKRLEETKGQLGWERIRKLEDALKKQGEDLNRAREMTGEYESTFKSLQQESLERLRAVEMAITELDEFIAYPHPDRPEFEDREIKVLRGKFAALWETDREHLASRLLETYYPIMSPNHKLGDGCSENL